MVDSENSRRWGPTSFAAGAGTVAAANGQRDRSAGPRGRAASASLRILVVDDDPANTALMTRVVGALGHRSVTAATAQAGLEVAVRERPDLVLLDVVLPGIDGHQVMRLMKAMPELAGVPIVALTALRTPGHRSRALADGFDGYLQKPIDLERVAAVIAQVHPAKDCRALGSAFNGVRW